jgi:nucleotide-binding universal stress UspA family protein
MIALSRPEDIAVSIEVRPGVAEEQLDGFIHERRADLVVVGVRPHTRFEKILIGSTTEMVLRRASCAVLTVPLSPDSV